MVTLVWVVGERGPGWAGEAGNTHVVSSAAPWTQDVARTRLVYAVGWGRGNCSHPTLEKGVRFLYFNFRATPLYLEEIFCFKKIGTWCAAKI